jgi:hypothetical protein
MQAIRIILLCIAAAVAYGIVHDQITARMCLEYFTVYHPLVVASDSPTVQGLVWGVIATWWVGLFLGLILAAAARLGSWPKRTAGELIRPMLLLMVVSAAIATLAGITGYVLATANIIWVAPHWANWIPAERHAAFLADAWAHSASYLVGFMGGFMLIFATLYSRACEARQLRKATKAGQT